MDPLTTLNGTWKVYISIDDGVTNHTHDSGAIAVDNSTIVYGNVSFAEADYELFVENDHAAIYTKLMKNATECDHWQAETYIVAMGALGIIHSIIPLVISVMVIMMVVGLITGFMTQMTQVIQRKESSGSRKGGKRKK